MMPRGLLLDAMGTLIGLRNPLGHTYAAVAARHGLELRATAVTTAFAAVWREAPPLAFPGLSGAELDAAERAWWGQRIDATLVASGAAPAPLALHHDLFDAFADPALWQPYNDVAPMLERWHRRGLRLAVVSNFDQRLHGLLAGLGLLSWLEVVVISSSAGAAKPSALPFLQALAALNLPAEAVWHVGDSDEDVEGARAAGIRPVRIRRR
ncbi:MAG: HAD-IA family hydrolase [Cyanobacteriota bacterium]|nr:HAD-IA family hydrolase [Cyanobacteriota bacterium]